MNTLQARWSSTLPRYQDTQTLMLSPTERAWIADHPRITYTAELDNYPGVIAMPAGPPEAMAWIC